MDAIPFDGNNFYRLKILNINGECHYSPIVKVFISSPNQQVVIPGNIITNNSIGLNLENMPAGNCPAAVFNSVGQLIKTKTIKHSGVAARKKFS